MKIRNILLILLAMLILLLTSCAAAPNPYVDVVPEDGTIAGFWMGLWHGVIFPFTFVISLITSNVGVYELHNNGGWYNFGYLLGLSIIFGGSGGSAMRRRPVVVVRQ